ncbi:MAG: plasmid recombination protein [Clostridia bacterium]|nr:plasmid recombination protein [Clostridia bacterium]
MRQYAILRFQKCKAGGIAGRDRHNERKKTEYKSNPTIDHSRSTQNYHLVEPGGKYKQVCLDRINAAGCRVRSNSTVMVETLVTASPEMICTLSPEQQKHFFAYAAQFLFDRVGRENVISAVVHMDEKTPHMHLSFVPITKDGRLSAKDILGNPKEMSKWQDDFHTWMVQRYPSLSRGIPRRITHRKHIPPYRFRMANELSQSYDRLMDALKTVTVFNVGKKRDEAMQTLSELLPLCYSLAEQMKGTNEFIQELQRAKRELEAEVEEQAQKISEQDDEYIAMSFELEQTAQQVNDLLEKQQLAQEILRQIPPEVLDSIEPSRRRRRQKLHDEER